MLDIDSLQPLPDDDRAPEIEVRLAVPTYGSLKARILRHPVVRSNAQRLANQPGKKRIVICADGTWNAPTTKRGHETPTNVWLVYQLIRDHGRDGLPQLKYYHSGVGTSGGVVQRVIDGASGRGLSLNMLECYRFLVENYNEGDHVYLFGFSRGAFTVRTLAGLIRNSGIIKRPPPGADIGARIGEAFALYRDRSPRTTPVAQRAVDFRKARSHPDVTIACIGVWDTVGALGIPVESRISSPIWWFNEQRAGFHDVTLSAFVDCAFHALAVDERRGPFQPTLWIQQPHAKAEGQLLEQVWFPGVHSDTGGGYEWAERAVANLSLRWMIRRIREELRLDIDVAALRALEQQQPPSFRVHDSMTWKYKAMDRLRINRQFVRYIDCGLGETGARDLDHLSLEDLHASVTAFEEHYKDDRTGSGYRPPNVDAYRMRTGKMGSARPGSRYAAGDRNKATTSAL